MVISPNKWELDVQGYLNLCNITSATPRKQIRDFAAGVNDLGLWNSMVCWPLRSSQNAGTGTTAYSLGGLTSASATLTNGPTWGANGAVFTAEQFASATVPAMNQDATLLFCASGNGSTYTTSFPHFFSVQGQSGWTNSAIQLSGNGLHSWVNMFHRNSTTAAGVTSPIVSGLSAASTFQFLTGSAKTGEILNVKNIGANAITANNAAVSAGTATLDRMQLNGRWAGSLALGIPFTCAFCAVVTPNISGSEAAIYTHYRNTLGTGLGLP